MSTATDEYRRCHGNNPRIRSGRHVVFPALFKRVLPSGAASARLFIPYVYPRTRRSVYSCTSATSYVNTHIGTPTRTESTTGRRWYDGAYTVGAVLYWLVYDERRPSYRETSLSAASLWTLSLPLSLFSLPPLAVMAADEPFRRSGYI